MPTRTHPRQKPPAPLAAGTRVSNIHDVAQIELDALRTRSLIERITERVTALASTSVFIFGHLLWFFVWILLNTASRWKFDPYPFSFLTLVVSLEAIVLTGFVLRDQMHMSLVSDRRAHLDLQVNLLAEQELTAILTVMCSMASHVGMDLHATHPELHTLLQPTDVRELSDEINRALDSAPDKAGARSFGS
jgi:uncharacterized membrane protein